jgi:hypothetical protein
MSAEGTTTRRRGGGGVELTSNDAASASAVLDLNRWTLQDDEGENEPLSNSANDDGGNDEVGNQEDAPLTVKLTDFIEAHQEEEYLTWQRGIGWQWNRLLVPQMLRRFSFERP